MKKNTRHKKIISKSKNEEFSFEEETKGVEDEEFISSVPKMSDYTIKNLKCYNSFFFVFFIYAFLMNYVLINYLPMQLLNDMGILSVSLIYIGFLLLMMLLDNNGKKISFLFFHTTLCPLGLMLSIIYKQSIIEEMSQFLILSSISFFIIGIILYIFPTLLKGLVSGVLLGSIISGILSILINNCFLSINENSIIVVIFHSSIIMGYLGKTYKFSVNTENKENIIDSMESVYHVYQYTILFFCSLLGFLFEKLFPIIILILVAAGIKHLFF